MPSLRFFTLLWILCWSSAFLRAARPGPATAVIIGVSDFQDPAISDLRFADRDAEAFRAYLGSEQGGRLPGNRIRLLTNEAATLAAIQSALAWQLSTSEPGTTAYLYLATHGDIEAEDMSSPGYLLAYDTPYNNYNLLALGVDYLDDHLRALAERDVQVVLITDACHAGSLSGNAVRGRQLTASRLMVPLASEIRLLSCQPYEFSFEGEAWGGGRGVFSFHLLRGLGGAADEDGNRRIDLYELEQFVQDRVSRDTDREQHPAIVGGRKDASPFAGLTEISQEYLQEKSADLETSFEDAQLALAPEEARQNYVRFHRALDAGALTSPQEQCALAYYRKLRAETSLLPLRGLLDERLTVALLDSVQQAIQDYLDTDTEELMHREALDDKYLAFPEYLAQAGAILGPVDPRYRGIEAKRRYFEGLVLRLQTNFTHQKDSLLAAAEEHLTEAVQMAPEAAYMHNELGIVYESGDRDSLARLAYERARELAPTWALPHNNLSNLLRKIDQEAHFADIVAGYRRAIELRPSLGTAYMNLGNLYRSVDSLDLATDLLRRAVDVTPTLVEARYNLANILLYDSTRRREAIDLYKTVVADRPHLGNAIYGIGYAYEHLGMPDSAEVYYLRALAIPDGDLDAYLYPRLGRIYLTHRTAEGRTYFRKLMQEAPHLPYGYAFTAFMDRENNEWLKTLTNAPVPEEDRFDLVTNVAVQLYALDALDLAVTAAELGTKVAPELTAAHLNLTFLLTKNSQLKEAARAARRTLKIALANDEEAEWCQEMQISDHYAGLYADLRSLLEENCPDWQYPPHE